MGAYDPAGRETILALIKVLRYLGITFGVLRKEKCNGDPARRLGNDLLFTTLAEENLDNIATSKATKFLSICPHCVRTMSTDWKEAGKTVEIEHHSELLARHKLRLPVAEEAGSETVVYHDPCYLGRYRGVYEEPREVLGRAVDLLEAPRNREKSFCCGAGGGQMFLGEEKGQTHQYCPGRGTGGHGRSDGSGRMSFLRFHVPRCVENGHERTAEAARHRADRGPGFCPILAAQSLANLHDSQVRCAGIHENPSQIGDIPSRPKVRPPHTPESESCCGNGEPLPSPARGHIRPSDTAPHPPAP